MQTLNALQTSSLKHREPARSEMRKRHVTCLWVPLLAATMVLSACGGGNSSSQSRNAPSLSGNWQFNVAYPSDQSFLGGLQGGFLLQKNGSVTGSAVYSVSLPGQSGAPPTVCNSGSAPIAATLNGQSVTLTASAGTQSFTFSGTLSIDNTEMAGTYTSTAGSATDGSACGTAQSGLQWSAHLVPPLSGAIQGGLHSTGGSAGLGNQDFLLTSGLLTQGENTGASNATVTGWLNFVNPSTLLSDYPCFQSANVNGTISGNTVNLQVIGIDGSNLGQIGGPSGSGLGTVTFDSTGRGYVLHSTAGTAYAINSPTCQGLGLSNAGDSGNICLALNASACQQPIAITPPALIFPAQYLGSTPTTQTITITNNQNSELDGLQLQWSTSNGVFGGASDFDGLPNFAEQDTCASSVGSTFSLPPSQSCVVTITFSPQQSCPWLPYGTPASADGAAPALCPYPLTALLTVNSPQSADGDTTFAVVITGTGVSALTPSTAELDFGAEAVTQSSIPQVLSFTNHSLNPVQILGSFPCLNNPPASGHNLLPHPLQDSSMVSGLQVVANGLSSVGGNITPDGSTINYSCDSDPNTLLPNFQITADTCTGALLASQASCSLQISYVPQPGTNLNSGLDHFLELNTLQCSSTDGVTSNCEIDSGRFPVELKANPPSPLRMLPSAGLDFGVHSVGKSGATQKITLFNDPADPNSATVNFVGKIVVKGDYSETDDCPFSLAPGASCNINVNFKPKIVGFDPGSLTINVTPEPTGIPQSVQLRGSGQ